MKVVVIPFCIFFYYCAAAFCDVQSTNIPNSNQLVLHRLIETALQTASIHFSPHIYKHS